MKSNELRARAEAIAERALDFETATERARFIAQCCEGDQGLEALIHEYLSVADSLSIEPVVCDPPASQESLQNKQIGSWKLVSLLGEGGFGVVYLAERNDGQVRQRGAIKFLKGTVRSADLEARFLDERQILANLDHPGIVRLIDAGISAEGQAYLVMDYIADGLSIDVYCRTQGLSIRQRLELFCRVCAAVAYAHRKLVVHRDLKPANILVTADGSPHLLDFGVARILDPVHRGRPGAAPTVNTLVGTERYFSPEQARREAVDTTSDIYSLGVIFYELLAGIDPYDLQTRLRESLESIVCNVDPVPPSRRLKELSGDIDAILMQALRKEADQRYSSVTELGDDIRRHLDSIPVRARADTLGYRLNRFFRRYRQQSVAVVTVFVALVVGLGIALQQRNRALREQRIATAQSLAQFAGAYVPNQPQKALALAIYAVGVTLEDRQPTVAAARNLLHQAVWLTGSPPLRVIPVGAEALAFGPQGQWLALAHGQTIETWTLSGQRQLRLESPGTPTALAISPDGRRLAAAAESTVTIWDATTGARLATLQAGNAGVHDIAFSPDSQLIALAGDRSVEVWRSSDQQRVFSRSSLEGQARFALTWNGSGGHRLFISGGGDSPSLWDIDSGMRLQRLPATNEPVIFAPDGEELCVLEPQGVTVWRWEGGRLVAWRRIPGEGKPARDARFSNDGTHLLIFGNDPGVRFYDLRFATPLRIREELDSTVALSADGVLLADSAGGATYVWPVKPRQELARVPGEGAALAPDGKSFATVVGGRPVLWDVSTGQAVRTLGTSAEGPWQLAFDPEGRRVAGSVPGMIKVWDALTGKELLRWSADSAGGILLYGAHGLLKVDSASLTSWDPSGRKQRRTPLPAQAQLLQECARGASSLALGGERLLRISPALATVLDTSSGAQLARLSIEDDVCSAALSPDGHRLATGTAAGALAIWDVGSGRRLLSMRGHTGAVLVTAFDPAGAHVVTGGDDGSLAEWNALTGEQELIFQDSTDELWQPTVLLAGELGQSVFSGGKPITGIAFSADGQRIAVDAGDHAEVRLYTLNDAELMRVAQQHLDRPFPLTAELCRLYLHERTCPPIP